MHMPWSKTIHANQTLSSEAGHQPPNAVLGSRIHRRPLRVDVAHDTGYEDQAAVAGCAVVLLVKMPARELGCVDYAREVDVEEFGLRL